MKVLYLAGILLVLSQPVFAAPLSPADRNSIEQQQQQLLLQNQQQRESLERTAPLARPLRLNRLCQHPGHVSPSIALCWKGPPLLMIAGSENSLRPGEPMPEYGPY